MDTTTAIETAIAATRAVRSIASWGDSADPAKLAAYCARRSAADGAQVVLAAHLHADVTTVAGLVERAAYMDVIADMVAAGLARVAAGETPARPEHDARRRRNLAARRSDAAEARAALARL